jgi:hypothetical protein
MDLKAMNCTVKMGYAHVALESAGATEFIRIFLDSDYVSRVKLQLTYTDNEEGVVKDMNIKLGDLIEVFKDKAKECTHSSK